MRISISLHRTRLLHVVLILSLPLLAACDRIGSSFVAPGDDSSVTFHFEQSMTGAETATGTFTTAGAIADEGDFEGALGLGGSSDGPTGTLYGGGLLTGSQGSMHIAYTGLFDKENRTTQVRFRLSDMTGAYAQIEQQSGTFEMTLTGAPAHLQATGTFVVPAGRP